MNRRTLAGIILLLWVGALGWLVQREYLTGRGPAETATSWPVPPGAAFQAVRLGERQVGLASIAVDTVGDSLRVVSLTTLDLPSADTANPRRTSERVVAIYSRRLQLLRWQTDLLTEQGRVTSTGAVLGDTLLREVVLPAEGTPDTIRLTLRRPVILPSAIPLVLVSRGIPRTGDKLNLEVFDPLDHELRVERMQVTAESLFTIPDSAEFSNNLRRWTVAHRDTVRAWRLEGESQGLPIARWVDGTGLTVRVVHPFGTVLERSAFELVQTNFRLHPPAPWDTSAAAPALLDGGGDPDRRPGLRAVASLAGGRPLPGLPPGLTGGWQGWEGDTLVIPDSATADTLPHHFPVAEPLLADDGSLAATAATILGGETRPDQQGRLLADWVARRITLRRGPDLTTAVATLARGTGTAAERNLLLAGLARAAGRPARLVWGLARRDGRWQLTGWVELGGARWTAADHGQPGGAARVRLAFGPEPRLLDLALRAGALRLTVLEDAR